MEGLPSPRRDLPVVLSQSCHLEPWPSSVNEGEDEDGLLPGEQNSLGLLPQRVPDLSIAPVGKGGKVTRQVAC